MLKINNIIFFQCWMYISPLILRFLIYWYFCLFIMYLWPLCSQICHAVAASKNSLLFSVCVTIKHSWLSIKSFKVKSWFFSRRIRPFPGLLTSRESSSLLESEGRFHGYSRGTCDSDRYLAGFANRHEGKGELGNLLASVDPTVWWDFCTEGTAVVQLLPLSLKLYCPGRSSHQGGYKKNEGHSSL